MLKINLGSTLCIALLLYFASNAAAQISGISGNKISSFSYDPIPIKKVEFEPTISTSFSKSYWDNNAEKKDFDNNQLKVNSNIYWRISYGLNKRTEFGLSATNDLSTINLATKVWLNNGEKFNVAAMLGYYIPLGNQTYNVAPPYKHLLLSTLGYGVIGSYKFDDKNQLDINLQMQHGFDDTNPTQIFVNADFGSYFLRDDLFLIIGAGYQQSLGTDINFNKLTIYPGFALETGKQFLFVINSQHDLLGKNNFKTWGLNLALTTSIF